MILSTILSGFGGQGLLFAGQVLAQAALDEGNEVTWLPSYGPEMRGGAASCTVIVSDRPIGSPIADAADVLIALNPPSLARHQALVAPGGLIVLNSTLVETVARADVEVVRVPCSALARDAGDDRAVSIVALGAGIARRPVVAPDSIRGALRKLAAKAGPETVERNLRAFDAGFAGALEAAPPELAGATA
ncbi:MAG TPA: 2-oxoacid:acceptor oxidoreductase family protein [Candidatus Limnocylindrales bacterium]|jgi:2-oxoglutarate ferredoxin oxidoreductase subunit gamma